MKFPFEKKKNFCWLEEKKNKPGTKIKKNYKQTSKQPLGPCESQRIVGNWGQKLRSDSKNPCKPFGSCSRAAHLSAKILPGNAGTAPSAVYTHRRSNEQAETATGPSGCAERSPCVCHRRLFSSISTYPIHWVPFQFNLNLNIIILVLLVNITYLIRFAAASFLVPQTVSCGFGTHSRIGQ